MEIFKFEKTPEIRVGFIKTEIALDRNLYFILLFKMFAFKSSILASKPPLCPQDQLGCDTQFGQNASSKGTIAIALALKRKNDWRPEAISDSSLVNFALSLTTLAPLGKE